MNCDRNNISVLLTYLLIFCRYSVALKRALKDARRLASVQMTKFTYTIIKPLDCGSLEAHSLSDNSLT